MDDEERKAFLDNPNQVVMSLTIGRRVGVPSHIVVLRSGHFGQSMEGGTPHGLTPRTHATYPPIPSALEVRKAMVDEVARELESFQAVRERVYLAKATLDAFDEVNAPELACEALAKDEEAAEEPVNFDRLSQVFGTQDDEPSF